MIDKKSNKALRVVPRAEVMLTNKETDFFQNYRLKGVPSTKVLLALVEPLVDKVLTASDPQLLRISEAFDYSDQEPHHSFSSLVCKKCTEMAIEEYDRLKNRKKICIPCAEKK